MFNSNFFGLPITSKRLSKIKLRQQGAKKICSHCDRAKYEIIATRAIIDKISQKDFANRLNISNNHLSNIERGRSAPSFLLFLDICSELKTNTDYIASGALYADIDDEIIQKLKKCSDEHKIIISDIIDAFLKS